MKYIRTKDRIYEVKATPETNELYAGSNTICVYDSRELARKDICCDEIIKQSDTVEELSDGFIHIEYSKIVSFGEIKHIKEYLEYINKTTTYNINNIYGFIKTDKGLIYVAKIKDVLPNGEIDWELL